MTCELPDTPAPDGGLKYLTERRPSADQITQGSIQQPKLTKPVCLVNFTCTSYKTDRGDVVETRSLDTSWISFIFFQLRFRFNYLWCTRRNSTRASYSKNTKNRKRWGCMTTHPPAPMEAPTRIVGPWDLYFWTGTQKTWYPYVLDLI